MAPDPGVDIKISTDVSEYQAGIIRAFVATLDDEGRAALLAALLEAEGMEKMWAIAKPDGSIELIDGEDPVAAADLVPSWRAVEIYAPKEPTDGE